MKRRHFKGRETKNKEKKGTHKAVKLELYGDASHGNGLRVGVVALALGLDSGQHHECAVTSEDIGDEAVMDV